MRLLFALGDTRVLLALGVACAILLGLATAWTLTVGADLERTQAELDALPPEERMEQTLERSIRVVEELSGQKLADPGEWDESYEDGVDFEEQLQAAERQAMVRALPPKPVTNGEIPLRNPRPKPLLSTTGVVGVSVFVGFLILVVGAGMSLLFLRNTENDPG